jgi:hypothetical protein
LGCCFPEITSGDFGKSIYLTEIAPFDFALSTGSQRQLGKEQADIGDHK